jgi:hypothetical protein
MLLAKVQGLKKQTVAGSIRYGRISFLGRFREDEK